MVTSVFDRIEQKVNAAKALVMNDSCADTVNTNATLLPPHSINNKPEIICARCKKKVDRINYNHKYCRQCSIVKQRERNKVWLQKAENREKARECYRRWKERNNEWKKN